MVKASVQITLFSVADGVDIQATYRYYLLQSSTLAKPSAPTSYPPPSKWSDSEPTYDGTSTNTLYFVDCVVFSDSTFSYSAVSKSTSYEAAKAAYNLANDANENVYILQDDVAKSKIGNLVKNGYGEYLDSTGFYGTTFTRGDCPDGCYGYFWKGRTEENIPFDKNSIYKYEYYCRLHNGRTGKAYFAIDAFDVDGRMIGYNNILDYNKGEI